MGISRQLAAFSCKSSPQRAHTFLFSYANYMLDLIPQSRFLRHWDADEDEVIAEVMVALKRTGRPDPKSCLGTRPTAGDGKKKRRDPPRRQNLPNRNVELTL